MEREENKNSLQTNNPPKTRSDSVPETGRDLVSLLEQEGQAMVEHLDELRVRIIISLAAFLLASVYGWTVAPEILGLFQKSVGRLVFIAPAEAFFSHFKVAVTVGLLIASPLILVEAWRFVLPALFPQEKRVLRTFLWAGFLLFVGGLVFGYAVVYPVSLNFFLSFGTEGLRPAIVVSRHLGFFIGTTLSFGLAFQLPVALLALVRLGVFTAERLREMRRPAVFFAFLAAGVFTPTDVVSQILMAIPLLILYQLAVWIAPRVERGPDEDVGRWTGS